MKFVSGRRIFTAKLPSVMTHESGQSLIQIMITVGIMGIMMLAFASMTMDQQREARALKETLASLDLERSITSTINNQAACAALFANGNLVSGGSIPYDATNVAGTPLTININTIPSTSSGRTIASDAPGNVVSPLSNTLSVLPTNGIQIIITGLNTATLNVNFDGSKLVRGIASLSFPLSISTSGPLTATTVQGCGPSQEAWNNPVFENGWGNESGTGNPGGYYKDSLGVVHLRGGLRGGPVGSCVFHLPVGYRPPNTEIQISANNACSNVGTVTVASDGCVSPQSPCAGTYVWIDGITFRAQ